MYVIIKKLRLVFGITNVICRKWKINGLRVFKVKPGRMSDIDAVLCLHVWKSACAC